MNQAVENGVSSLLLTHRDRLEGCLEVSADFGWAAVHRCDKWPVFQSRI